MGNLLVGRERKGPSPRARGNHSDPDQGYGDGGSIPACAGKPFCPERGPRADRVHPRVRGETSNPPISPRVQMGPSPRARGNHKKRRELQPKVGSIPACAGKPAARTCSTWMPRVHPRVRGETRPTCSVIGKPKGPSPRARGNLYSLILDHGNLGSIPACAGKPVDRSFGFNVDGVHPRVRGETSANTRSV